MNGKYREREYRERESIYSNTIQVWWIYRDVSNILDNSSNFQVIIYNSNIVLVW